MGRIDKFLARLSPKDRARFKKVYDTMAPMKLYHENRKPKDVLEALFVQGFLDRTLKQPKPGKENFKMHWAYYRKE